MNEIEELFPFYVLGVLSVEEKAQVEAYVAKDAMAKARLEEMLITARALPYEAIPILPSESAKTALMARVRADSLKHQIPTELPPTPHKTWLEGWRGWFVSPAFSVASIAALIGLGIWIANLQARMENLGVENRGLQATVTSLAAANDKLQASVTALEQENQVLRDELLSDEELIALFTDPARQEIPVAGTAYQPEAQGTLLIAATEGTTAVLIASNLPPLPTGMAYQFWLIKDGAPIGAGVFSTNEQGHGLLIINSAESPIMSYDAVGITIEPEGGSVQPTGNVVLFTTLPGG